MKYLFFFILLSGQEVFGEVVLRKYHQKINSKYQIQTLASLSSKRDLQNLLRDFLKKTGESRFVGSEGHEKSYHALLGFIKKFDPAGSGILSVDTFTPDISAAIQDLDIEFKNHVVKHYKPDSPDYKKWKAYLYSQKNLLRKYKDFKGRNIIWEKTGTTSPKKVLILGAHYDSITTDKESLKTLAKAAAPGANDNASGVTTLLYLINYLAQLKLPETVRVVFFDFEELGLLGSKAFVEKYKKELKNNSEFRGFINVEMLGHDTKIFDKTKKLYNLKAYTRLPSEDSEKKDARFFELFNQQARKGEIVMKFHMEAKSFPQGSHTAFWTQDLPAFSLSQNWEDDHYEKTYHSANDFPETLNFTTLHYSFKYLLSGVLGTLYQVK